MSYAIVRRILKEIRPVMTVDPYLTLGIAADELEGKCEPLCTEAAKAIRYWLDVRTGVRMSDPKWDRWLDTINQKYGHDRVAREFDPSGNVRGQMMGKILTFFTEAWFDVIVNTAFVANNPIFDLSINRLTWAGLPVLANPTFQHVENLTLDFRHSANIVTIGVVRAVEYLRMPRLRRLHITVEDQGLAVKGVASVALMQAALDGHIPKAVELWWNGTRT